MNKIAKIGEPAPQLQISNWVKGEPNNLDQLLGQVILIEVFQVNCPGCFLYSLPKAIDLHQRYQGQRLSIIGMATAFEDFDKNNLKNLQNLVNHNQVIGETLKFLRQENRLINGKLPYVLPFPIAMDQLLKNKAITHDDISALIEQHIPDYANKSQQEKLIIQQQATNHLQAKFYTSATFTQYALQGTPSYILVDKKGILRACEFGQFNDLEWYLNILLQE